MNSPTVTTTTRATTTSTAFRFRRYREEVALRSLSLQKVVGETETKPTVVSAQTSSNQGNKRRSSLESGNTSGDGTVLQNLSNTIVVIHADGKVSKKKISSSTETNDKNKNDNDTRAENDDTDNAEQREPICVVPEETTLLLRNLRDCVVTIHLPLPAVHFVGIENTEIVFYNRRRRTMIGNDESNTRSEALARRAANTTIHMTDCRGKSSLQLETSAQQLRIHKAIGLFVEMMVSSSCQQQWGPGSIILEASKGVVFSVPRLDAPEEEALSTTTTVAATKTYWQQVIIKDFQWLRKGIASPNFQVEVLQHRNSDSIREMNSRKDPSEAIETTNDAVLRRISSEESEDDNASDSEDEL